MKKKKGYQQMTISRIEVWSESPILVGSVTNQVIEPGKVTVKDFTADDPSFPTDGFDVNFD